MAEKKHIPAIRFKGFNDEWELRKLEDITNFLDEQRKPLESGIRKSGPYPYYGASGVIDFVKDYLFDEELILLSEDGANIIDRNYRVCFLANGKYWVNNHAHVLKSKDNYSNAFLCESLERLNYEKYNTGTAQPKLNQEVCRNIVISTPNVAEQTKIGSYFQNFDKLISLHQAKVDKLVNLKKAMLEKMFPKDGAHVPEIRFKGFDGAWEKSRFGDCVLIQRGGSPRPIESFITNEENGINWIKIGDVSKASRYITKTKEKIIPSGEKYSRRVYAGDLILSNSMSFGRPYIMAIEGCIHDGWLVIRDENKLFNLEYLLQLLSSDFMLEQYKALASGGVVINLNSELVQSTTVYVPILAEQEKIGAYFQNLDNLIALHQTELDKLNNLKKACLEKMFV